MKRLKWGESEGEDESGLTVMESTAECGDRLTENKAQISKILLPTKINVLVDI